MKKISCVISALNEGPRIENVLGVVSNHPLIDEVIVVDDGSSDDTIQKVKNFQYVKVIEHKENKGKTCSMLDGCHHSEHGVILFLDGDLVHLTKKNISEIVNPVLNDSVDMSIGMIRHDSCLHLIARIVGHGAYSGQRAMKKDIALKNLVEVNGYAAEAILNQYVLKNNLHFNVVNWYNVKAISRVKEQGLIQCYLSYIKTFQEIFEVVGVFGFFKQLLQMRKHAVKDE